MQTLPRELGRWDTGKPGPTLLITGGIHGNEPAGVLAAQRVLAVLHEREPDVRGRVVALSGNRPALAKQRRFLDRDLNRGWDAESIAQLQQRPATERSPEDEQQHDLLQQFDEIGRSASGALVYLDLHTSSADGAPFLCLADTIDNRRLGLATGVPIILGIEETIEGASLEWFAERGIASLAVEGGRHECPAAVDNHEAVLWIMLTHLGILPEGFVDLAPFRERLVRAVGDAPPIVEIVHRRKISAEERFRMEPGFLNFARVAKGHLLARDRAGDILAPYGCHVVMPLYQELGDDGFFLARRVRSFWLWLARWLRWAGVARLLRILPGIRRDPDDANTLLANRRVARWFVVEVFHLLGYRKQQPRGDLLAFRRRLSRPENRRL
ncbi:MAG: succinylglutamate desuccinylase/aspartoacylase family protein [Planctomycetota bacterium]